MAILWRKPNSSEPALPGAVPADISALRIDKPTLVFLNGFFVLDDNIEWAAASLERMEEVMANRPAGGPAPDIYSWTHEGMKEIFNVMAYRARPDSRANPVVANLTAGLIMPLVARDFKVDEAGQASGTPLPLEEAKKNLRNITFFGYSAGCVTAQECFNASMRMMQQIGYAEEEARAALHEVVYVGTGVVSRPEREKDRFTTIFLEGRNDKLIQIKEWVWRPLRAVFSHFARDLKIREMGDHALRITAPLPKKDWEIRMRDGKPMREKVRALLPSVLAIIRTYHESQRYMTQDENLSPFANMVQFALTNAVARQGLCRPMDLLAPPPGTDEIIADAYRAKIKKAFVPPAPA